MFDAFASPNYPCLIEASVNIKVNSEVIKKESTKSLRVVNISPQAIGIITLYPGISTSMIEHILDQPLRALIILTYGLGNAPQNSDFLACLSKANERGIILVNLTQCQQGKVNMGEYETSNTLSKIGVISGSDMTTEAAIAKLYYLLSTTYSTDQIRAEMQRNLVGELTE